MRYLTIILAIFTGEFFLKNHIEKTKEMGKTEEILIEGRSETAPHILSGRTRSNRLVNFTLSDGILLPDGSVLEKADAFNGDILEGQLALVRITGARPYSLEGRWESFII